MGYSIYHSDGPWELLLEGGGEQGIWEEEFGVYLFLNSIRVWYFIVSVQVKPVYYFNHLPFPIFLSFMMMFLISLLQKLA